MRKGNFRENQPHANEIFREPHVRGEFLSRITNDVDTLGQSLNQSVTQIITSVATLVGTLVMMISISGIMTLISLVILPVSAILISFIIKHSQKYFRQQQEYLGHINGQVEEVYGGHLVVQAYNKQESTIKKFEDTNQILFQSAWKSQFLSGLMQPIMQFVGNLGYVGVAILEDFWQSAEPSGLVKFRHLFSMSGILLSRSSRLRRWQTCCSRWLQPPSAYLNFWTKRKKN